MRSDYYKPLNPGHERLNSIKDLAYMALDIADVRVVKEHMPGPWGVRGRNS